ncbi:PLP-dependent cysteine synthase family protein [Streptomyces sp. NBC_00893]|uniref:PLP-dependent cysteine synthase family protein n=1 Tax=Streptomyces sp. NBC_00893 TaxID=2975862 RepID=UPI002253BFAB|nr:pyridoxal-phosphate dependent enzyme [Streptomyces sp. NBC_00893]MCX4851402.1 pyridoxal-phosphate dependent enzyme [Streptomyces sp. NBC_00893]
MTTEHPNSWAAEAIRRVEGDGQHLTPTPLRPLPLPAIPEVEIYLKDESAHPTGSLKFRLVRAMFCDAIASGAIRADTPVVAATSGAVAVAGAHFARLLGLVFTAVVPAKTSADVLARIEEAGGRWQVGEQPPAAVQEEARALAERLGGHFLDHFTDAERALAACGEPTIADEIFIQLSKEPHPIPTWIVTGAGTGATSATIGRHLRRHGHPTRLAVVDPENSAYFPAWASGCADYTTGMPSRIPGIGRPRTEPGFLPTVIDLMIPVPDAASIAALRWLRTTAGIEAGPATGTNFWGTCHLVARMSEAGVRGSIVTIIGDTADPYRNIHLNAAWVRARGLDPTPYEAEIERFARTGEWPSA